VPDTYEVAVIVGSLRKDSYTRKVATALMELAPPSLKGRFVEIGDLPLYNQDIEEQPPAQWATFRDQIRSVHAVLFATPEYNRSVPGCLKNALDVGSRPYGKSVWAKKPAAIVSVSPGAIGGFGANHHLRQSLVFLDMLPLQQPEAYVGGAATLFTNEGELVNDATREFFKTIMSAFERLLAANCVIP
jgi:chromate reductase, NAD(P)H dehydrogenase (quinone)